VLFNWYELPEECALLDVAVEERRRRKLPPQHAWRVVSFVPIVIMIRERRQGRRLWPSVQLAQELRRPLSAAGVLIWTDKLRARAAFAPNLANHRGELGELLRVERCV
jgi:hypothetical protein